MKSRHNLGLDADGLKTAPAAHPQTLSAETNEGIKMDYTPINFQKKLAKFSDHWSPKIIAQMNDYHFKLVKFKGDFVWHSHDDTDEVFIVLDGEMSIEFRDGKVNLKAGEMFVVPKGVEHKPLAERECKIMLVEPAGTVNTGNTGGEMTTDNNIWI
jgi:mannose-6-phosphate isomerase-like protein (cupin superfamily)